MSDSPASSMRTEHYLFQKSFHLASFLALAAELLRPRLCECTLSVSCQPQLEQSVSCCRQHTPRHTTPHGTHTAPSQETAQRPRSTPPATAPPSQALRRTLASCTPRRRARQQQAAADLLQGARLATPPQPRARTETPRRVPGGGSARWRDARPPWAWPCPSSPQRCSGAGSPAHTRPASVSTPRASELALPQQQPPPPPRTFHSDSSMAAWLLSFVPKPK